jgi:hypothetical protein
VTLNVMDSTGPIYWFSCNLSRLHEGVDLSLSIGCGSCTSSSELRGDEDITCDDSRLCPGCNC